MLETLCVRNVVVGSGCAGLNAADVLSALGEDVVLLTEDMLSGTSRNTGSDKQTYYKLSLSGDEGDSVGEMARDLWYQDTNGDTALCEAAGSVPCFMKLAALGVPFPTNAYGEYVGYRTDHDPRMRATSAGPLTSRMMTEALEASVMAKHVQVLQGLAARIVTGDQGVEALDVWDGKAGRFYRIRCANVILCTGGPAHVYLERVYPESQHGMSGLALACGAEGANLHCWQYGLASLAFRWNLSGSYQQVVPRYVSVGDDGEEREFLREHLGDEQLWYLTFLKGYQWPFDPEKVPGSSEIDLLVKHEKDLGRRVYLDYRRNPSGFSFERLPKEAADYLTNSGAAGSTPYARLQAMNAPAIQLYLDHGIDLEKEMLEIGVCAQHHNGGIAVDSHWQSSVTGLYVCGEAAGTFGRKRPGGSALNSTQVGSQRAARHCHVNGRQVQEAVSPWTPMVLPRHADMGQVEAFQREMTRVAGIERDRGGMEMLSGEVLRQIGAMGEIHECGEEDILERLLFRDILWTQRAVLSAMLKSEEETEPGQGIMITREGTSTRVAARPMPQRDLWFERVWKRYREEQEMIQ
ncbi:MAG: FAD-binding protein [Clostridia bacterium]|nr:FAD-binding protein [Clostridia bacterium]